MVLLVRATTRALGRLWTSYERRVLSHRMLWDMREKRGLGVTLWGASADATFFPW